VRVERGKPIDLATALRFLPLIVEQSPSEYDGYAVRWLVRSLAETPAASVEGAAQVANALAALPVDRGALDDLGG
jgi:hypothetical protein